jgi:hypothetical protein
MNQVKEWFFSGSTWGVTLLGITTNWDTIKSNLLFISGFILLILQIAYQIKKLKMIRDDK